MNSDPALKNRSRANRYHGSIAALKVEPHRAAIMSIVLFAAPTHAAGPALECHGVKPDNPAISYELTITALDANSVVIQDASRNESCACKFKHSGYFDQSKGMVPRYIVIMAYQSCDVACPQRLKRLTKASIDVTHRLGRQTHSTPFVGDEISNCDRFSIDVPRLRKIEGQRIDGMDLSDNAKRTLKDLKGIDD